MWFVDTDASGDHSAVDRPLLFASFKRVYFLYLLRVECPNSTQPDCNLASPMNGRSEATSPEPTHVPPKLANQIRFETELEFVQCLANPHYLASLAMQGLLAQPNFIAYLRYLTYWLDVDKGFGRFIV